MAARSVEELLGITAPCALRLLNGAVCQARATPRQITTLGEVMGSAGARLADFADEQLRDILDELPQRGRWEPTLGRLDLPILRVVVLEMSVHDYVCVGWWRGMTHGLLPAGRGWAIAPEELLDRMAAEEFDYDFDGDPPLMICAPDSAWAVAMHPDSPSTYVGADCDTIRRLGNRIGSRLVAPCRLDGPVDLWPYVAADRPSP